MDHRYKPRKAERLFSKSENEKIMRRHHLVDVFVDGSIILKRILSNCGAMVWKLRTMKIIAQFLK